MTLNKKYLYVVILSSILVIINQIIIQYTLAQKKNDAKTINISGKQRMLSQKLTALVLEQNITKNQNKKAQILKTFEEWESVHYGLQKGNEKLGINKVDDKNKEKLFKLNKKIENASELIWKKEFLNKTELKEFSKNQVSFLSEMDKIVKSLEKISDKKLNRIIFIEIILAIITLTVIYSEVLLVFRPMINDLQKNNTNLNRSNKTLEEYAYIASHDLRTPIINILSFVDLVKKKQIHKLDNEGKLYFKFIEDSAIIMDETTKDLLKFSLAGKLEIKKESSIKIIQKAIETLTINIERNKAEIKIGEIPETIYVDNKQLQQVFVNLIENSIKYTPKNDTPKIEISGFEKDKEMIQFNIKDNGIGIAKEDQEKVFKIFKRLHNQKKYKGTGIGLSLVQKIIENHGGKIWIESELEEGTTIKFTIPKNIKKNEKN